MRSKLLFGLLALGALAAGAPAASAQILQVSLGRGGFQAELGYASSRGSVRARIGHGYEHGSPSGHWQEVRRQVWIPGATERVWEEPRYEYRTDSCGRVVRVLVRPAGWRVVECAGRYEWRTERVWVPARSCAPYRY